MVSKFYKKLISLNRYRDSTQSFAALATQSAMLSQSDSALFDSDHPSLVGVVPDGIGFCKLSSDQQQQERSKLGITEWEMETP